MQLNSFFRSQLRLQSFLILLHLWVKLSLFVKPKHLPTPYSQVPPPLRLLEQIFCASLGQAEPYRGLWVKAAVSYVPSFLGKGINITLGNLFGSRPWVTYVWLDRDAVWDQGELPLTCLDKAEMPLLSMR